MQIVSQSHPCPHTLTCWITRDHIVSYAFIGPSVIGHVLLTTAFVGLPFFIILNLSHFIPIYYNIPIYIIIFCFYFSSRTVGWHWSLHGQHQRAGGHRRPVAPAGRHQRPDMRLQDHKQAQEQAPVPGQGNIHMYMYIIPGKILRMTATRLSEKIFGTKIIY